jgi:hypothetical protein
MVAFRTPRDLLAVRAWLIVHAKEDRRRMNELGALGPTWPVPAYSVGAREEENLLRIVEEERGAV